MGYIPGKAQTAMLSERQFRRRQEQQIKKIEKKYGKHLPIPTEEDMQNYIDEKTHGLWLNQVEKPTK